MEKKVVEKDADAKRPESEKSISQNDRDTMRSEIEVKTTQLCAYRLILCLGISGKTGLHTLSMRFSIGSNGDIVNSLLLKVWLSSFIVESKVHKRINKRIHN